MKLLIFRYFKYEWMIQRWKIKIFSIKWKYLDNFPCCYIIHVPGHCSWYWFLVCSRSLVESIYLQLTITTTDNLPKTEHCVEKTWNKEHLLIPSSEETFLKIIMSNTVRLALCLCVDYGDGTVFWRRQRLEYKIKNCILIAAIGEKNKCMHAV